MGIWPVKLCFICPHFVSVGAIYECLASGEMSGESLPVRQMKAALCIFVSALQ